MLGLGWEGSAALKGIQNASARIHKGHHFFSLATLLTLVSSLSPPLVSPTVSLLCYRYSTITRRLITTMAAPAHSQGDNNPDAISTPSAVQTHESELQIPLATEPKESEGKSRKADIRNFSR